MHTQRSTAFMILLLSIGMVLYFWFSDIEAKKNIAQNQNVNISVKNKTLQSDDENNIKVETDLYSIIIDLNGGDIVKADLKDQKEEINSNDYFHLLQKDPEKNYIYIAQSNIYKLGQDNAINTANTFKCTSAKSTYNMNDLDTLNVELTCSSSENFNFNKIYTFNKNQHTIKVFYKLSPDADVANYILYSSLIQSKDTPRNNSLFMTSAYRGAAYSNANKNYSKEKLDNIAELKNTEKMDTTKGGWVSMIQHYFVSAWIGSQDIDNTIIYSSVDKDTASVGILSSVINNPERSISNTLWIGPKNLEEMEQVAPNLELTIDYGWLSFFSIWLFKILNFIYGLVGNWGLAIIITTLLVRGAMYKLTKKQFTSMAKMRLLAPKIKEIQQKYGSDRQRVGQEMMALYQKEKVNPMSGCFPILIQMPIFIALYWTLLESTELRHSPFCLWIQDLSTYDPYFVLPLLYGATMFLIQKMSPQQVTDPLQKKIFTMMPIIFTAMFCTFPAGLTLYWVVSNIVTIVQQKIIYNHLEKVGLGIKNQAK